MSNLTPWLDDGDLKLYHGDCLDVLRGLPDRSVHMCATSPPFYGLRDYGTGRWEGGDPDCDHIAGRGGNLAGSAASTRGGGHAQREGQTVPMRQTCGKCGARRVDRQIGLEESPDQWVGRLVEVFRELRRVLRDDGTLWVEIGDSYHGGGYSNHDINGPEWKQAMNGDKRRSRQQDLKRANPHLKPKDLVGQPWMLAFALRADGWYLRSEIIWARPNPMPESVTDRPTKAHSTIFLLAKGQWKSRVVALSDLRGNVVHLRDNVGPKDADVWAHQFGVRLASSILDFAESEYQLCLPTLDSEVWQKRPDDVDGLSVAGLPVEHRAAVYAARFLSANAPAKEFLCELDRLGVALSEDDKFLVLGGSAKFPLPPGVNRYGKRAIAIHDSGEIGEIDFVSHELKFSRPVGCSYFYDADAIREKLKPGSPIWGEAESAKPGYSGNPRVNGDIGHALPANPAGANARSVWTVPTEPTPFAHFATWPQKLVARMVKAGTSEHGCCPECGAPWERVTEVSYENPGNRRNNGTGDRDTGDVRVMSGNVRLEKRTSTLGWQPSCSHDHPPVPCTVLDIFAGSGTTLKVARDHGRHSVGIELNEEYLTIARDRLSQLSLLTGTGE